MGLWRHCVEWMFKSLLAIFGAWLVLDQLGEVWSLVEMIQSWFACEAAEVIPARLSHAVTSDPTGRYLFELAEKVCQGGRCEPKESGLKVHEATEAWSLAWVVVRNSAQILRSRLRCQWKRRCGLWPEEAGVLCGFFNTGDWGSKGFDIFPVKILKCQG